MNFETQILSKTYAEKLKKIGITKGSFFKWESYKDGKYILRWPDYRGRIFPVDSQFKPYYQAYTSDELLEILPKYFHVGKQTYEVRYTEDSVFYQETTGGGERKPILGDDFFGKNKPDNYAKMLVFLIEHAFINPSDL